MKNFPTSQEWHVKYVPLLLQIANRNKSQFYKSWYFSKYCAANSKLSTCNICHKKVLDTGGLLTNVLLTSVLMEHGLEHLREHNLLPFI